MDKKLFSLIQQEQLRQKNELQLIPSENYASFEVLKALGSVLTNKYSEGYSGKRYYQGNINIDKVEDLAIERAKKLFKAEYVNIQPLSGSPANLAVYLAVLKEGDTILSMNLASGGHLSHGSPVNLVSRLYKIEHYDVNKDTEQLDYEQILKIAKKVKPKLIIAGASAYSKKIDFKQFSKIAKEVNAILMADIAHIAGLVAGGVHMSPVGYADIVTTTTHKTLRGPRGGMIMAKQEYSAAIAKNVFPGGVQAGPHNNVHAAKAVAFYEALKPSFKKYSANVVENSKELCKALQSFNYKIVSGGTDNHLMLINLTNKNIGGKDAAVALEKAGIIVNYNMIPYDTKTPFNPSGIRLGTPAVTSRKMGKKDMQKIATFIDTAISKNNNLTELYKLKKQVANFTSKFYLPGIDDCY